VLCRLTKSYFRIKYSPHAEVAELADALGSGLSDRKIVRVQVPPSAPFCSKPAETQVICSLEKSIYVEWGDKCHKNARRLSRAFCY
jgi:hypothetical protein